MRNAASSVLLLSWYYASWSARRTSYVFYLFYHLIAAPMTANDIQFTHRSYHCIIVHCLKRTIESHKIKIIINHTIMKLYLSFLISLAITSYANSNCLLSCTLKTENKISFNKCFFKCIGYERGAGFPDWDGAKDDDLSFFVIKHWPNVHMHYIHFSCQVSIVLSPLRVLFFL